VKRVKGWGGSKARRRPFLLKTSQISDKTVQKDKNHLRAEVLREAGIAPGILSFSQNCQKRAEVRAERGKPNSETGGESPAQGGLTLTFRQNCQ